MKRLLLGILSYAVLTASALAYDIACPSTLPIKETLETTQPAPWKLEYIKIPHQIATVEFRQVGDGDSTLMYDDTIEKNAMLEIYLWWFPDSKAAYQVKCVYDRTNLYLVQTLPSNIRSCYSIFKQGLFQKSECSEQHITRSELNKKWAH